MQKGDISQNPLQCFLQKILVKFKSAGHSQTYHENTLSALSQTFRTEEFNY